MAQGVTNVKLLGIGKSAFSSGNADIIEGMHGPFVMDSAGTGPPETRYPVWRGWCAEQRDFFVIGTDRRLLYKASLSTGLDAAAVHAAVSGALGRGPGSANPISLVAFDGDDPAAPSSGMEDALLITGAVAGGLLVLVVIVAGVSYRVFSRDELDPEGDDDDDTDEQGHEAADDDRRPAVQSPSSPSSFDGRALAGV